MLIDPAVAGCTPDELRVALETHNIEARPAWKPMHQQPLFRHAEAVRTGVADDTFDRGICLPSGSTLADEEQDRIIRIVRDLVGSTDWAQPAISGERTATAQPPVVPIAPLVVSE